MQTLIQQFDKLQLKYGEPTLNSVYGGGQTNNPKICLVFMNPTARNIATAKTWQGPRYQWLGTKQIWKFLSACGLFSSELNLDIQSKKAVDWTPEFCEKVYDEVRKQGVYITNLAKCSQLDARHLDDSVFEQYKGLLLKEIELINPGKVIMFGNQVSSIVLDTNITVSTCRKQKFDLSINNKTYNAYCVYYPVGNGFFNLDKAIEDLSFIKSN